MTLTMQLDNLLKEMLSGTTNITATENQIKEILLTEEGYNSFMELLISNNKLAFIFLNRISGFEELYLNGKLFIDFVAQHLTIKTTERSNLFYIYTFINKNNRKILLTDTFFVIDTNLHENLISFLIKTNRLDIISEICKKFQLIKNSSETIYEVDVVVKTLSEMFLNDFLQTNLNDKNTYEDANYPLNFFYLTDLFNSLIYQDLHTIFEDNLEQFFRQFYVLYGLIYNDLVINKHKAIIVEIEMGILRNISNIFIQFVTKYSECIDVKTILVSFCNIFINNVSFCTSKENNKTSIFIKSVLNDAIVVVTKAFGYCNSEIELVFMFICLFLDAFKIDQQESNNFTPETITLYVNNTEERDKINELIGLCKSRDENLFLNMLKNIQTKGNANTFFYIMQITKIPMNGFESNFKNFLENNLFDGILYLLKMQYISIFSVSELFEMLLEGKCNVFLVSYYFSEMLRLKKHFYANLLLQTYSSNKENSDNNFRREDLFFETPTDYFIKVIDLVISINLKNFDKYTSCLTFHFIEYFLNSNKFNTEHNQVISKYFQIFQNILNEKVVYVTDPVSVRYYFDVYILLSLNQKVFDGELVAKIVKEEIIEIYDKLILYLIYYVYFINSVEKNGKSEFIDSIIESIVKTELFYKKHPYNTTLLILTCYKYGSYNVNTLFISNLINNFNNINNNNINNNNNLNNINFNNNNNLNNVDLLDFKYIFLMQYFVEFFSGKLQTQLNIDMKNDFREKDEVLFLKRENDIEINQVCNIFLSKKFSRMIVFKLIKYNLVDLDLLKNIIAKNLHNLEHELSLHSIHLIFFNMGFLF
ncbi:hypothetical protein EHP00_258 [Ecytonucleospora hepatopenaei]|uniref:Uncharacterized protein n=1 Tax=Ecytonucleospora hepatopenaei TaxID=646526 RepID=A0A1W0E6M9_9MICR|nr:hypothetical protein EHP00_258 [Ecytonucleospora hepatopenaei]